MYNELYHHGVKGQRWGVRRYQNKDGTLTPAGKKRAASKRDHSSEIKDMSNDELRKKVNRLQMESRYYDLTKPGSNFNENADAIKGVSDNAAKANKIVKSTGKAGKYSNVAGSGLNAVSKSTELAKKINSKTSEKKHAEVTRKKLENMDDRELASRVERLDLERQYSSLKKRDVDRGRVNVRDVLSVTGDVLAIGASAVTIAIGINKLKNMTHGDMFSSNDLYHHGIKGQRWGVRRYQNKDGTLTPAGKKKYYDTPELNKQRSELKILKRSRYFSEKDADAYYKKKFEYSTNKEVARIRSKEIQFENKSKHRLKLEEQYKKKGLNNEQAQAAANNRIRTEKILAASAAITVSACAAYIANKKLKDRIDGVIKSGETMQRIEMRDTEGKLNDVFYAAKGKHDTQRYEGLLGMTRKQQTGHAYLMKLQSNSDIKVASKDNASKIFGDLYKNDPEFRKSVSTYVDSTFHGTNKVNDINNISSRNIKKMYENFNVNLIDIRESGTGAEKKFYAKLKSSGYGAIQDINDMKYSGYNAKNPLIIFDNSNVMVRSMKEMSGDLAKYGNKELLKASGEASVERFLKKTGPIAATTLTAATISTYRSDPNKKRNNRMY